MDWSNDARFLDLIVAIVQQIQSYEDKIIPKTSIYKLPSKFANRDTNSPHFVSIGPIHGGQADLVAMEEIKLWYSMFFFYRFEVPAETVLKCGEAIINLDKQAREYYAHGPQYFNKYELMKILLIDGCFLLELFLRHSNERDYTYLEDEHYIDMYKEIKTTSEDLILGSPGIRRAVCEDLVLLENQIPLVVLETLLSFVKPYLKSSNGFKDYALRFFSLNFNAFKATSISIDVESRPSEEPRHILEVLHKGLLPSWMLQNGKKKYGLIYSATKLLESGVDIKKNVDLSNETGDFNINLLEIKFDSSEGILTVPQFWIGGTRSLITKNLVAFEQYSLGRSQSHHVTAYVLFMNSLISSEDDIKLLKRKGIIMTHPGSGSNENVMEFFNACSEGVALKDFYFSNVCEEVEEYSKSWMRFHSYVTCLQSKSKKYAIKYTIMTSAFFGATTLLILAFLQTFFTIFPYYRPHN